MKGINRKSAMKLVGIGGLVLALAAVTGSMLGCGAPKPANVILIVVDTLRADHLSAYGYSRPTSPSLVELAARGTTFDSCYSHSSATRPSVATIFSSRFVAGHGVATQGGDALPAGIPILAETLKNAGFTCRGFITNPQIHPDLGFARGFDEYRTFFPDDINPRAIRPTDLLVKVPAETVLAAVKASLQKKVKEPFFLYVHLLDTHGPYEPQASDLARFADPDYHGTITGSVNDFARIELAGRREGADLQHFVDVYDATVLGTDRALGDFFHWFWSTRWSQDTHLIVTADHGEEFMEHGGTGHGLKLYEETTSVPLLWSGPGVKAANHIHALCGLVDIFPTIADIEGVDVSHDGLRGRSLRSELIGGASPDRRRVLFLDGPAPGSVEGPAGPLPNVTRGLRTTRYRVIAHGCVFRRPGWTQLEVYDEDRDPGEQHPVFIASDGVDTSKWAEAARSLYERTAAQVLNAGTPGVRQEVKLTAHQVEQLRSLGYVN